METTFTAQDLNAFSKENLIQMILEKQNEINKLTEVVMDLQGKYNKQIQQRFGRSTETSSSIQQLSLFNEVEAVKDENKAIEEPSISTVVKSYKRKRPGKRKEDLKGIPVHEINIELKDSELKELFPNGYNRLPDQIYNKLRYIPAQFINDEYHIAVYKSKGADKTIVKANRPVDLLQKSIATPELVSAILNYKYVNAGPLNRIAEEFKRNEINISRQVMCSWVIKCAERYLSLVYDKMKVKLLKAHVIHSDETPCEVRKDGRPAGSKSYMWVFTTEEMEETMPPIILYDYEKTRGGYHAEEFLEGFQGILVTDSFSGYHSLEKRKDEITNANCWVHAKRNFAEEVKITHNGNTICDQACKKISSIFHENHQYKDLDPVERRKARQEKVKPMVDDLFLWAKEKSNEVAPKSNTGKAIQYLLNQEKYLRVFLDDPEVSMDNNVAERAIRPFTLGRKNFYLIDTISGAQASAICYSIAESAKANNLKPYAYFKYLLTEIPKHMEEKNTDFLDSMLPWSTELPIECKKQK